MPSFSRIATAVVVACLAIGHTGPASAAGDASSRRRELEAQRAQAAAKLNVLRASQTQIQKALNDLDSNVRSQQSAVASANQAADAAAKAYDNARAAEAEKIAEVGRLRDRAAEVALDAYMGTTRAAPFDMLKAGNIADIARR